MSTTRDKPNYDVEIAADELLSDLAALAAEYGEQYEEYRRWWQGSLDHHTEFTDARYWMLEQAGGQEALSKTIATLQPESNPRVNFRNDDGSVDVRGLMRWLSERGDRAHERSYGDYTKTRQADEAETAYASVLSQLRDDYGVGWPRLSDVSGTPLEEDLP